MTLTVVPLGLKHKRTSWFGINLFLGQALHSLPALVFIRERKRFYAITEQSGLKFAFQNYLEMQVFEGESR